MRAFALPLAALALALAACAGGASGFAVTHTIQYDNRYYPNQVAGVGAPLPVEVRGATPPGVSPADVASAMRLPAHINRGTTLAEPGDEEGQRIVVAFARASGRSLCDPEGSRPAAAAAPLTMAGAYCYGDQAYSSAITVARDGNLPNAAENLARVLLPIVNPLHKRVRRGND